MNKFFKENYNDFDSYTYHFVEFLKEIFGERKMMRRYSLQGEGIFNLLYIDNSIYEFKFKEIKSLPISDGKLAFRDTKKDEIIAKLSNILITNNIDFSITDGKFICLKNNNFITQIEIIKKIKEPANLGKTRINGEWV